ncbi:unnamed protein product [Paramecium octaurelia]|uniref:Uncharacterized protein n=1 Tax=Paramecium octaurelia TaxID=43137 RepID=A0A8S1Y4P1_PAROT|nr:unnamed protein product [Paramecium octaurelia]
MKRLQINQDSKNIIRWIRKVQMNRLLDLSTFKNDIKREVEQSKFDKIQSLPYKKFNFNILIIKLPLINDDRIQKQDQERKVILEKKILSKRVQLSYGASNIYTLQLEL